jgi:hypothetical protein
MRGQRVTDAMTLRWVVVRDRSDLKAAIHHRRVVHAVDQVTVVVLACDPSVACAKPAASGRPCKVTHTHERIRGLVEGLSHVDVGPRRRQCKDARRIQL